MLRATSLAAAALRRRCGRIDVAAAPPSRGAWWGRSGGESGGQRPLPAEVHEEEGEESGGGPALLPLVDVLGIPVSTSAEAAFSAFNDCVRRVLHDVEDPLQAAREAWEMDRRFLDAPAMGSLLFASACFHYRGLPDDVRDMLKHVHAATMAAATAASSAPEDTADGQERRQQQEDDEVEEDYGEVSPRARQYAAAATALLTGQHRRATNILEAHIISMPRDLVALRLLQNIYVALGEPRHAYNCVGRAYRATPGGTIYAHALRSCFAYGSALNAQAENAAMHADAAFVMSAERDMHALHARAQAFDYLNSNSEGKSFLVEMRDLWEKSNLRYHLGMHLALMYMERDNFRAATRTIGDTFDVMELRDIDLLHNSGPLQDLTCALWISDLEDERTWLRWITTFYMWRDFVGQLNAPMVDIMLVMSLSSIVHVRDEDKRDRDEEQTGGGRRGGSGLSSRFESIMESLGLARKQAEGAMVKQRGQEEQERAQKSAAPPEESSTTQEDHEEETSNALVPVDELLDEHYLPVDPNALRKEAQRMLDEHMSFMRKAAYDGALFAGDAHAAAEYKRRGAAQVVVTNDDGDEQVSELARKRISVFDVSAMERDVGGRVEDYRANELPFCTAPPGTSMVGVSEDYAARQISMPVCESIIAFREGRHDEAARTLLPLREHFQMLGADPQYCDTLDRTLLSAMYQGGTRLKPLRALLSERTVHRGTALTWVAYAAACNEMGLHEEADEAFRVGNVEGFQQRGKGAH